jgi:histidyl-tRNA synthetase
MQKQMKYANDRGVQFVAIVGDEEIEKEIIKLKNMESGEQFEVTIDQLIEKLK